MRLISVFVCFYHHCKYCINITEQNRTEMLLVTTCTYIHRHTKHTL